MKKILPMIIIGILVLSGLGAVALTETETNKNKLIEKTTSYSFLYPTICEYGQYVSVELKDATSFKMIPGEPMMPKITKVYTLPFDSTIKDVTVKFSEVNKQIISKEVRPAPEPIVDGENVIKTEIKSEEIYSSSELYPEFSYNYRTSAGLYGNKNVIFLTVQCFPVRYSPAENMLYYSDNVEIRISYEEPTNPVTFGVFLTIYQESSVTIISTRI